MKKSMMKGMTVLVASMAFASCSHEAVYDENYGSKQKGLTYEQAFVKRFGAVSPDQEWDFTKVSNAGTRAAEGEVATAIAQFNFATDGFDWIWESGDPRTGEMNNSDYAKLIKSANKTKIKNAVEKAELIDWNAEKYKGFYFRLYAGSKDGLVKSYQRFCISTGSNNYWLAQLNPNNDWVTGDANTARPRYIDLTKVGNLIWFIISQEANKETEAIKASDYKLKKFKEVMVNIDNVDYTFWAFDCNGNGVSDLVLWVKAENKPEAKVTEKRYMAEDLGGDCDTDFNDVVFDLIDTDGKQKMIIRAMGGKLDIAIFVNGKQYWRKSEDPIFKVSTMYNTTSPAYGDALKVIEGVTGWDDNANNVAIAVYGDGSQANAVTHINFPLKGSIPRMIAVSTKKHWQKEKDPVPGMAWFAQLDE